MGSLRNKTISGIFWAFMQKVGSRGISFVVMIILARLLTPKDFGLIGMLIVFVQISQAVVEGGFNLALIQKKDTDELDYSSVFWINLIVSIILYLIVFCCAPYIAQFYRQDSLTNLVRVLSLVFVINAFSIVQEARLTKEIRFKTLMIVHLPSVVIGGLVSISMAFMGFGVWCLVVFQLITRFAYAIQIWLHSKWTPLLIFDRNRTKRLFSFGSKLLVAKITGVIYNNIFLVVIGRFFPVASVGYYQNSFNLINVPSSTITSVLNGVTFPAFSSIQDDNLRLKASYKRIMQQVFFWICPMYMIAGILATPLFSFIFGLKWLPAVPYFQWLCIVGILAPLNTYNLNIVNVKGRSDVFLKLQLIRRGLTIIAVFLTLPYGITALLVVQAFSVLFAFLLFSTYSGRFISFTFLEQVKGLFPIFLLNVFVGIIVFVVNVHLSYFVDYIRLVSCIGIGGGLYFLGAFLFRLKPYNEISNIIVPYVLKIIKKNRV